MMEWVKGNPQVAAALVAAFVALCTSLLTHWLQPWSQGRIERLKAGLQKEGDTKRAALQAEIENVKAQLDTRKSATTARQDYEYEARKRLYEQVEPLLFQMHESLEEAHYRIRSLARTARQGDLGWLTTKGYYLRSTAYKLFLPVVHFRLLQRHVTFVDLKLDDSIALRYRMMKLYVRSLTDDFDFARLSPPLSYQPNRTDLPPEALPEPRQGLVIGSLESIADLLIAGEGCDARACRYTEFDAHVTKGKTDIDDLLELVRGFSPVTHPILARMMLAQACFSRLILETYHHTAKAEDLGDHLERILGDESLIISLGWSKDAKADLSVVRNYWRPRIEWLKANTSWVSADREQGPGLAATAPGPQPAPPAAPDP